MVLAVLVFASINANMAAKALAHSSYFKQAAVREFLLKTDEKKTSWYLKILSPLQQSAEEEGEKRTT